MFFFDRINVYIKEKNLKDRKIVNLDDRMKVLFGDIKQPVTFFSLCHSVSPHFASKVTPEFARFLSLETPSIPRIKAQQMIQQWAREHECMDKNGDILPKDELAAFLGNEKIAAADLDDAMTPLFPKKSKVKKTKRAHAESAEDESEQPAAKRAKAQ